MSDSEEDSVNDLSVERSILEPGSPKSSTKSGVMGEEIEISEDKDGIKSFVCPHCPKRFRTKAQCQLHISSNHRGQPFSCKDCDANFQQYFEYRQHRKEHYTNRKYPCTVCEARFARVYLLRTHWNAKHRLKHGPFAANPIPEEEQYKCKQCAQLLSNKYTLAAHEKTHAVVDGNASDKSANQCNICLAVFKSISTLKKHLNKHAGVDKKSHPCTMCDATFTSREGRRVHMILKHNAGKTYKCEQCPMVFARKGNLRLHMTTHGIRLHICSICGQSFARIESLRNHEGTCAEGKRGLSCEVCGQRFRKQELLDKHLQQGHPEKEFQCNHCGQGFETKRALSHHVRVHEGTFRCEYCPQQFVTEKALRNHEKSRHWEILGIERVIGKQGRRKGAPPKLPKERVRRNKNCPFLGLEHLAELVEKSAENADGCGRLDDEQVDPDDADRDRDSYKHLESENSLGQELHSAHSKRDIPAFDGNESLNVKKQELLGKHLQQGHPKKDFPCKHCDQRFETKWALSHHVRVHEGTFRCEHCSQQFVTEKALRNHGKSRRCEILGIERVIGKQGKRKDPSPKLPKECPFLSLEHLADLVEKSVENTNDCGELDDEKVNAGDADRDRDSYVHLKTDNSLGQELHTVHSKRDIPAFDGNKSLNVKTDDQTADGILSQAVIDDPVESKFFVDENLVSKLTFEKTGLADTVFNSVHKEDVKEEPDEPESSDREDLEPLPEGNDTDDDHDSTNGSNKSKSHSSDHGEDLQGRASSSSSSSEKVSSPKPRVNRKSRRKRKSNTSTASVKNPLPKKFKCDDCDKCFARHTWWSAHRAKTHGVQEETKPPKKNRIHFCSECPKSFSDWRNLIYHMKHIHKKEINEKQMVNCKSCKKKLLCPKDLKEHTCFKGIYSNREPEYKCDLCDKAYVTQHGLESHRSVHSEYHRFNCDVCSKPFANEKDMHYHKKRVHVEASFVCEVCGKAFKVQTQLKTHVQIHLESKGYQCEYCGRSFAQRNGMTAHLRIAHAEQLGDQAVAEREITCTICAKRLKGKTCYRLHMKTHTNDRPFSCSYCDKRFVANQDKLRHEQTHTKEYKFKCRFCNRGSTRRKLILLHEAKQHNEFSAGAVGPQHKCSFCGRSFSSPSAVAIHESLHSDELPVACELCDRRFKNVKYMKYHLKAHHKQSDGNIVDGTLPMVDEKKLPMEAVEPQVQSVTTVGGDCKLLIYASYTVEQPVS